MPHRSPVQSCFLGIEEVQDTRPMHFRLHQRIRIDTSQRLCPLFGPSLMTSAAQKKKHSQTADCLRLLCHEHDRFVALGRVNVGYPSLNKPKGHGVLCAIRRKVVAFESLTQFPRGVIAI